MSDSPRLAGSVNERLYFCRLLLDRAEREAAPAASLALAESAVLQLRLAYSLYLQELASGWRLAAAAPSAAHLRGTLEAEGRAAAELLELEVLEREDWLGTLLEAASALERPRSAADPDLIRTQAPLWSRCREWQQALEDLIARHREQTREW